MKKLPAAASSEVAQRLADEPAAGHCRGELPAGGEMIRALRLTLAAVLALLLLADQLFPPPLPGRAAAQAQVVLARDGTPLRAFPDRTHVWRHPVRLEEVSPRSTT